MATRITIIEETSEPVYDPGLPGALKSIFTVVLFIDLIQLFMAASGAEKPQWLVLLFIADVFFWIAMVNVFHSGFEGTGLLLRAILKSLKLVAIGLAAFLFVIYVLVPLLPGGLKNLPDADSGGKAAGTAGKVFSWLFRLALIVTGIMGGVIVLRKRLERFRNSRYSPVKEKARFVLEIASTAVIILLMGTLILLPLLGEAGKALSGG